MGKAKKYSIASHKTRGVRNPNQLSDASAAKLKVVRDALNEANRTVERCADQLSQANIGQAQAQLNYNVVEREIANLHGLQKGDEIKADGQIVRKGGN